MKVVASYHLPYKKIFILKKLFYQIPGIFPIINVWFWPFLGQLPRMTRAINMEFFFYGFNDCELKILISQIWISLTIIRFMKISYTGVRDWTLNKFFKHCKTFEKFFEIFQKYLIFHLVKLELNAFKILRKNAMLLSTVKNENLGVPNRQNFWFSV